MAYAAYTEFFGLLMNPWVAHPQKRDFVVMDITVPSLEADLVRRVLARCTDVGVLRCIPRPSECLARLELHLPVYKVDEVMHCLMECVPSGQIGPIYSWAKHLSRHGLTYGN